MEKKKGKVKWYSKFKKYGFIVDEQDNEYIFFADRIKEGKKIPKRKDVVYFSILKGKKGLKAKDIDIVLAGGPENIKCPNCHNDKIPKVVEKNREKGILVNEIKKASICKNCGYEFENHIENEQERVGLFFRLLFLLTLIIFIKMLIF